MIKRTALSSAVLLALFGTGSTYAAQTFVASGSPAVQGYSADNASVPNADGTVFVFQASGNAFGASSTLQQIFLYNKVTNTLDLVSRSNTDPAIGANSDNLSPVISDDGTKIVFLSAASNLVAGSANGYRQVFLYDATTKSLQLISKSSSGTPAYPGGAYTVGISGNGRFIAYATFATNIIADTNGQTDIYVYDTVTGETKNITVASNSSSHKPSVSDDGRFVAFETYATSFATNQNLTDSNGTTDVYVVDVSTGETELVSRTAAGTATGNRQSTTPQISGNGRFVTYLSYASDITAGVSFAGASNIYLYDRDSKTNTLISTRFDNSNSASGSYGFPTISRDGRYVGFFSNSPYLIKKDTNTTIADVFVYDRNYDIMEVASLNNSGVQLSSSISFITGLSKDGRTVTFAGADPTLPSANGSAQTYARLTDENHAPVANAGAPYGSLTKECNGTPSNIMLDASASYDPEGGELTYEWKYGTFIDNNKIGYLPLVLGSNAVKLTVTDNAGASGTDSLTVYVQDTLPPTVNAGPDVTLEATGLTTPYAIAYTGSDACSSSLRFSAVPSSFYVGTANVRIFGYDSVNRYAYDDVVIKVQDTTPPTITAPAAITKEATGALTGVSLGTATAKDLVTTYPTITNDKNTYTPSLPVGVTTITWTAKDAYGNAASATQLVTITDTKAPTLTLPAAITKEATGPKTIVTLGTATASDLVDGSVTVTNDAPADGFDVGTHVVTYTATDSHGNVATGTQSVTITDTTGPVLTLPASITAEATAIDTPASAVNLDVATVSDLVDQDLVVENDAPATFAYGDTTVTYRATDKHGNVTSKSLVVKIVDTTPPTLSLTAIVNAEAEAVKTIVDFGEVNAQDIFMPVTVSNDAPVDGFEVGAHVVTWKATDAHQLTKTTAQQVVVHDTTAPSLTPPADVTAEAQAVKTVVSLGSASAIDKVDAAPVVSNNAPADGYALGQNTVTWTAVDKYGNASNATQRVNIVDTTAPTYTMVPPAVNKEATGALTSVSMIELGYANAYDIFLKSNTSDAQASYPVGAHTVTWTAEDTSGNRMTAHQAVNITDTTAPTISAMSNISAEAPTSTGVAVNYISPTATDIVDANVAVSCAPASGSVFPVGTTTVTCSARDFSGNTATTSFNVNVTQAAPQTEQYEFGGFVAPLKNGGIYKLGRVLPVKIVLTHADGTPVTTAKPTLAVYLTSNGEVSGDPLLIESASNADVGNTLRYTGTGGEYIYNLATSVATKGTYRIIVNLGDNSAPRYVDIALK